MFNILGNKADPIPKTPAPEEIPSSTEILMDLTIGTEVPGTKLIFCGGAIFLDLSRVQMLSLASDANNNIAFIDGSGVELTAMEATQIAIGLAEYYRRIRGTSL